MKVPKRLVISLSYVVTLLFCGSFARAEIYPTRTIKIIVPHPAGAQIDALARIIGKRMSDQWGRPVVVENKPGANGNLGAQLLARSEPDGYTVMFSINAPFTTSTVLFKSPGYDADRDLQPVAIICRSSNLIAAKTSLNVKSLAEVIQMAKAQPGKLSMGSAGYGTGGHFVHAELTRLANIDLLHVPYRGSPQANTELAEGVIDLATTEPVSMLALAQSGAIRLLAVTGPDRLSLTKDIPTVSEAAIPGFDVSVWIVVSVPKNTPHEIVQTLNTAVLNGMNDPGLQPLFEKLACGPTEAMSPDEAEKFIQREKPRWIQMVHDAKLEAQ
jgi:tripartite-type tricarboxylate transporter receptor subunit TctC